MKINEIFYSIQGEGFFTGTPAVFVRFAGCNLACDFCDTNHRGYKEYTENEIIAEIKKYTVDHVVLTGGEPTLQITKSFIDKLHEAGKFIQVETNGTIPLGHDIEFDINWITCSPKHKPVSIGRINELKVVYQGQDMSQYDGLKALPYCFYLQPCDTKDEQKNKENLQATIDYIMQHPKWRLSLQTQKIINVR